MCNGKNLLYCEKDVSNNSLIAGHNDPVTL